MKTADKCFLQGNGVREEPRITVEAEDPPERMLLETKICKEDGFQKQQGAHAKLALVTVPTDNLF
jgi:hypothetical protein